MNNIFFSIKDRSETTELDINTTQDGSVSVNVFDQENRVMNSFSFQDADQAMRFANRLSEAALLAERQRLSN